MKEFGNQTESDSDGSENRRTLTKKKIAKADLQFKHNDLKQKMGLLRKRHKGEGPNEIELDH